MKISYSIDNFMTRDIVSVDQNSSVRQAIARMVEKNIGSVVITKGKEKVGIMTERDVLKKLCFDPDCAEKKVSELMSSPLVTIEGKATVGRAADLMAEKGIRRLLVTKEGRIEGIITERDVMKATLEVFKILSDSWA
jgi:signal-transduction protein with cAMP-binding, CBS, and nucleotidyltransferase domain